MKDIIKNKKALNLIKDGLAMFEPRSNGEGVCFTMEAIQGESKLYRSFSDLIATSEYSTDTIYSFVNQALNILSEVLIYAKTEDELQEAISEQVDSYTPIYNSQIMDFIKDNYYQVDEAIAEMGKRDSLIEDGQTAYYMGLERTVNEVIELIKEIN